MLKSQKNNMKKIFMIAISAFLVSGVSFAQDSKKCEKGKTCCKNCKKGSTTAKQKAEKKDKTAKI